MEAAAFTSATAARLTGAGAIAARHAGQAVSIHTALTRDMTRVVIVVMVSADIVVRAGLVIHAAADVTAVAAQQN